VEMGDRHGAAAARLRLSVPRAIVRSAAYRESERAQARVFIESEPGAAGYQSYVELNLQRSRPSPVGPTDLLSGGPSWLMGPLGQLQSALTPSDSAGESYMDQVLDDGVRVRWLILFGSGSAI
jgi:hypothetical protein